MFEFFELIANFFTSIWEFLSSFIEGIINFFALVAQVPVFLYSAIGSLPSVLIGFGFAIITVSVVKVLVGR